MSYILRNLIAFVTIASVAAGCATKQSGTKLQVVYASANDASPLQPGSSIPNVMVTNMDGSAINLQTVLHGQPTVLIFFRGGWCPFCSKHLAQLQTIEAELRSIGFQIVAVSTDRYDKLQASVDKGELKYILLSGNNMYAASAFGIAFKVDDETIEKYKGFNINLDEASGRSHHLLPVPTVFIVDADGIIRFTHSNPDYKTRLSSKEIWEAALNAL